MRTIKVIFSLAMVKGLLAGLVGTGAGAGLTMLIRLAMKLPAWNSGPVLPIGILIGVITYLAVIGIFNCWFRRAIGSQPREESTPPAKRWTRYFNVDTNHKVIGVQYVATSLIFLPFAAVLQLIGRLD